MRSSRPGGGIVLALCLGCLLPAAPRAAMAQQQLVFGDTIVEILGLRTRTAAELQQEVARYVPELTLASAACAAVLRDSIGFADAAVSTFSFSGRDTVWTLIRLIEPADSNLVRYTTNVRSSVEIPDGWERTRAAFRDAPAALAYFQHAEFLVDGADSVFGREVPVGTRELRSAIRSLSSAEDRAAALHILRESSNAEARQLAALVASNFPEDALVWYALVESFRAGSDHGAAAARMVFTALARTGRYRVNWEGGIETVSAVLGGTNLLAYDATLDGLVDTAIDPGLARELARVNPELLADHAAASTRFAWYAARRFLVHAGSPDWGSDREAWMDWMGL